LTADRIDVVFAPGFVNYKKGCTRLAAASDKVYQLLAHGRWFSPGTPTSSTTKTGRHDIAEILLKVALNTEQNKKNQIINKINITTIHLKLLNTKNKPHHKIFTGFFKSTNICISDLYSTKTTKD